MDTIINLQFNDDVIIKLSTSSFIYKHSSFLQSFDLDDDNDIPILCPSSYIMDNNKCIFDDKIDLLFMFTLQPLAFINVCKFLDIIHYDNSIQNINIIENNNNFNKQFILYVMTILPQNTQLKEELKNIYYFMRPEIKSILNYINNESLDLQIRVCTVEFYALYFSKNRITKDVLPPLMVIKHNRIDIYNNLLNKNKNILMDNNININNYYKYVHKYNNQLTDIIKQTQQYKDYVIGLSSACFIALDRLNTSSSYMNEIKKLVNDGANINYYNEKQCSTLLHRLSFSYQFKLIKWLIENGGDINTQDSHGNSILFNLIHEFNDIKKLRLYIKYLIEHGANINLQNKNGDTVLHHVFDVPYWNTNYIHKLNKIILLLEFGSDINLQNNFGTILHLAAWQSPNLNIIKYIVEHGIDINLQCYHGIALCFAVEYADLNIVKYLVEHGSNIHYQHNNIYYHFDTGNTLIHYATNRDNNFSIIEYLVKNGANIKLQNNEGNNALHIASYRVHNLKVIQYLIEHYISNIEYYGDTLLSYINLQNNDGFTALHFAVNKYNHNDNLNVVKYLVKLGINIRLQNNKGETALDMAIHYRNTDIINYLKQVYFIYTKK